MRNLLTALLTAGALLGAAGSASAGTATTTFTVTATVNTNCKVSTPAAGLTFNYTPGAGPATNTTTVTVNCTKGTPFNTELTAGTTTGSNIAQRLLDSGGNTLQYNLYSDSAWTKVWGVTPGTDAVAGTGGGMAAAAAVTYTVYGQVVDSAPNQAIPTGTYTDTITVNVAY